MIESSTPWFRYSKRAMGSVSIAVITMWNGFIRVKRTVIVLPSNVQRGFRPLP